MTFSKLLAQSLIWRGFYFISLFGVNVMLSRTLQASGSGILFYIVNTFFIIQLVASVSLENGITFFSAGKHIASSRLFWLCLFWTFIIVILQLVVFFVLNGHWIEETTAKYAFFYITGSLLITYTSNLYYAEGNFVVPNIILSLFNVVFVVFLLFQNQVLGGDSSSRITTFYFVLFLLQGVSIALAYLVQNQCWREFALPHANEIKQFFRYSLTVLLFNVLLFLVYRVDYYFVRYSPVCTTTDLGNYIQASKLGQMLLVVPQIIGSAVYPQVSSGKEIKIVSRIILLLMKLIVLLFFVLFLLVFFLGKWLFPFLLGHTFQQVQTPFLLLLPGIYSLAIISFVSNFFSGQGNVRISVRAAFIALLVVVIGDFIFVSRWGVIAAAIVSSIGYWVMFMPYWFQFKKIANVFFQDFFRLNKEDISLVKEMFGKGKKSKNNANE